MSQSRQLKSLEQLELFPIEQITTTKEDCESNKDHGDQKGTAVDHGTTQVSLSEERSVRLHLLVV